MSTERQRVAHIVVAIAVAFAGASGAQAQAPTPMPASMGDPSTASTHRMRVSELLGHDVTGAANQKVGDLKDLIVNLTTGDVRYALIEFDPGFFKSNKLYAVPVSAFSLDETGKKLVYRNITRAQLLHATVGKQDSTRAVDNRRYLSGLDQNYGFKPPAGTDRSMRVSSVMSRDVDGRSGKGIGRIKDLVVDMGDAKVEYAVLSFDPSWFAGAKLFAFPLTAFKTGADTDDLTLDVDRNMIASMKAFDTDKWGSLNDLNRDAFMNAPAR